MQFSDRFRLKRKWPEVGEPSELFSSLPYNSIKLKRPCELQRQYGEKIIHQTDCSETSFWSPRNDFIQSSNHKIQSSSMLYEEEMSNGGSMYVEKGSGASYMLNQQTTVCDTNKSQESSVQSFHEPMASSEFSYSYNASHAIRQLSLSGNQMDSHDQSSVKKESVKGQGCQECLAGKSGHFHHIGRWRLMDTPSGYCQL